MQLRCLAAISATALIATTLPAQTNDIGRSISRLIETAVTTNKQRQILVELAVPLAYEPAAGTPDPNNRSDPRNMDIGGVRLGMTVKQAQAALRNAGYRDAGPRDDQPSYAGLVMDRWQSHYGYRGGWNDRAPHELLWRKGEEEIRVTLVALPEGPRVDAVSYQAKEGSPISGGEFVQRVLAKYGKPTNDDAEDMRWCTVKAPTCEDSRNAEYPLLSAWTNNRTINLTGNDPGRKDALERRFAADVERRKPEDQAPSF
jgi:hypothetical protein